MTKSEKRLIGAAREAVAIARGQKKPVRLKVQPEIDAAIVDAFKQWRFQPPVRDGKPATAYMVMSMNYRVN